MPAFEDLPRSEDRDEHLVPASNQIFLVVDAGTPVVRAQRLARAESLSKAPARHIHQPAGLHVWGNQGTVNHDDIGGAGGMMSAVMKLAEMQTTADEASPDDDRHNDNGVHADRIDNVWGESGHGRSAPLQPRPVYHDHDAGIVV
jgi:hypothetical protein